LEAHADALFGVGLEGGINKLGDRWYEGGWIAVTDRAGAWGIGSTAKFELSKKIVDQLLAGKELAEVIDEISGLTDVRSSQGAMVRFSIWLGSSSGRALLFKLCSRLFTISLCTLLFLHP
jgi:non-canonical (house-cleaning) NTP pyrophosphatase